MSDLVERLAKARFEWDPGADDKPEDEARWWLKAVAELLEHDPRSPYPCSIECAEWLRTEADR